MSLYSYLQFLYFRKYPPYDIFNDKNASEEDKETSKEFKNEHGFVHSDVWNLDYTFACFILPRLCYFRDTTNSIPNCIYKDLPINGDNNFITFERNKQIEKGLNLFSKYFTMLWDQFYIFIYTKRYIYGFKK